MSFRRSGGQYGSGNAHVFWGSGVTGICAWNMKELIVYDEHASIMNLDK
jgi:hypothetical protein